MSFLQVAFMPYIECSHFKFGNLGFQPFHCDETKKQLPKDVVEYLEWYFNKYIDMTLSPLNIVLVSYGSQLISHYSDNEIAEMYDTMTLLSFLSIWNNNSFSPLSSDNFTLYIKNFSPTDKSLATSSGGFINTNTIYSSKVAEKIVFIKPEYIPSWKLAKNPWLNDSELFVGMSNAIINAKNESWFKRIIRSSKIFNTSYSNINNIGFYDRILLLVTSIEAIFDRDTGGDRKFSDAVVEAIGFKTCDGQAEEINKKIKSFSTKLYKIRSVYSHGNELPDTNIIHPIYGNMFKCGCFLYGLIVKSILTKQGFIQERPDFIRGLLDINMGLFRLMNNSQNKDEEDF